MTTPENAGKPWTEWEKDELRAMAADGTNYRECAAYLKRGYHAVRTMARKLGLSRPDGRQPDLNVRTRVLALLAAGLSVNRIAKVRRVSRISTLHLIRRMVADGLVLRVPGDRHNTTRYVPAA